MPGKGRGGNSTNEFFKSGTSGDDVLDGTGASFHLSGGRGDDTYIVDDQGDEITEKKNGGDDTVLAEIDWVLSDQVENIWLQGSDDLQAAGNGEDNTLIGNTGANTLTGGLGNDTLDGGEGIDTARFSGNQEDFIIQISDDQVTVRNIATDEVDHLSNIELLVFDNATVDLTAPPPGAGPIAVADAAEGIEDASVTIDVLANDEGQGLVLVGVTNGAFGMATANGDGTVTYTPSTDAFGTDVFNYTVRDENGLEATAEIEVYVQSVNDAPIAVDDAFDISGDPLLSGDFNVLANDTDIDGDTLDIAFAGASVDQQMQADETDGMIRFTTDAGGTVELGQTGDFSYEAAAGYSGDDSFHYSIADASGALSSASVHLSVATLPPTDPPSDDNPYYIEALLAGDQYRVNYGEAVGSSATVTFAFAEQSPDYYDASSPMQSSFQSFTGEQRTNTLAALENIESLTGLTFVETTAEQAEMTFGFADIGFSGLAYLPSGDGVGNTASDIWIEDGYALSAFEPGTTSYKTLVHEVGHALGLVHPELPDGEETRQFSILAGNRHETMGLEEPSGYMLYDIAALQHLYGANDTATAGDDVYTFADLDGTIQTIWDAGGHDVIDVSGADYGTKIDLREGSFSTVSAAGSNNVGMAYGTRIEDVVGSNYNDTIVGNADDNVISAGAGDDLLTGGGGADVYQFQLTTGQDIVTDFDKADDVVNLSETGLSLEDINILIGESSVTLELGSASVVLDGLTDADDIENWAIF